MTSISTSTSTSLEMLFPVRGRKLIDKCVHTDLINAVFRNVIPREGTETSIKFLDYSASDSV